ncbi:MAG TPA: Asp-tRNA(Asn)/Glu-tRNA(Gln) amidotransferase subunit GatC [Candidatus Nanoarchaeia archaeon]|nr:Asp-tRNA(Asn)/Glu-tRNA(Gln) amidotransferase subunit GatC [Candidatus Nanoarchaeia archaeon]
MKIDQELTRKVAKTARLNLTKEEEEKFTKDLQEILKAFSILDSIDIKNTRSSFRPIEQQDILREDEEKSCIDQEEALKFTKNKLNGFFIGPRTIE